MGQTEDIQAALGELEEIEEINKATWDKVLELLGKAMIVEPGRIEKNAKTGAKRLLDEYEDELPDTLKSALATFLRGEEEGEVAKALRDEFAKEKAELMAEIQKAQAEARAAKEAALREADLRKEREFLQKAQSYTSLGADTELLAKSLQALADKDATLYAYFETVLKAANAQIAEGGLFKELGTAQGPAQGNEFERLIATAVKEQMAKGLTEDQAYAVVMKSGIGRDRKVQAAYQAEREV